MRIFLRWMRNIVIFFFVSTIGFVVALKYIPVFFTPLMIIRSVENTVKGQPHKYEHHWVPLEDISRNMPQAVIASEDNRFMEHNGFDFEAIYQARLEALHGKKERGASTISQQTAKNVFLWPAHSWVRKGLEAYFTVLIEFIWGKERIMEVYLNSIEMGNSIYGVAATSRIKFKQNPQNLTPKQAALIATTLPNPRERDSGAPTPWMEKRSNQIIDLMNKIKRFPYPESQGKSSPPNDTEPRKRKK